MSRKQESLRDLIESRAASHGIAPRTLRRWALEAIVQGAPKDDLLDTEFSHGGMRLTLRTAIGRLLHANDDFDPFKFSWVRSLTCDPKEFDRWLNVETKAASSPGISRLLRRKRPRDAIVRRVVQNYVNGEQSTGLGTAIPRMWDHVKKELPGATHEQAVKALRAIEGGRKRRGRPRLGTPVRK